MFRFSGRGGSVVSLVLAFALGTVSASADPIELTVYTYDSLAGRDGWLTDVKPGLEKACDCRVRVLADGDGGQLAARLQFDRERGKPAAHLAVGIDQFQWPRLRALAEADSTWRPAGLERMKKELREGLAEAGFFAFDHGVFAFMLDEQEWKRRFPDRSPPASLRELLNPRLGRTLLLQDPRTSTPGQAFALYLREALGAEAPAYVTALRAQWLTLAPGWNQAYGLFLRGEAPLVWSYTTSAAYHRKQGQGARYRALVFAEGNPLQIEGAFVVAGPHQTAATRAAARRAIEHLLSTGAQSRLPERQWMLPAREDVKLPASFEGLARPRRALRLSAEAPDVEAALREWERAVRGRR